MSVYLNGFSVSIKGNEAVYIQNGKHNYFSLPHMAEYSINLTNNRSTRCDAEVSIDGESVGIWRIEAHDNIILERPANTNRRFVFVDEKSSVAQGAGIEYNNNNGLIKVVFSPERATGYQMQSVCPSFESDQLYLSSTNGSFGSGATVLGGRTRQNYGTTNQFIDIDEINTTTIYLRLIVSKHQPYISIKDSRHFNPFTLKPPPRIERDSHMPIRSHCLTDPYGMTSNDSGCQWASVIGSEPDWSEEPPSMF